VALKEPVIMTIHIVAILKAKPGQESELRQALLTLIPPVLQEPGCIQYTLHESLDHPGHFVFYEAWADQAAIDRHGQTTHFQAFVSKCDTLLAEPLQKTVQGTAQVFVRCRQLLLLYA
jgi:quinol monooxygenase YgiN